jgi:hypothetical protein
VATKQEIIGGLELVVQEARRLASALTEGQWEKTVDFDGWKNREVLAHVAATGGIVIPFMGGMAQAPEGSNAGASVNIDELNATLVAQRAGKSAADLADEVKTAYGAVIEWVRGAPDDLLAKKMTFGGYVDVPISDLLVRMVVLHGLAHVYSAYAAVMNS